jgi:amino acid permease
MGAAIILAGMVAAIVIFVVIGFLVMGTVGSLKHLNNLGGPWKYYAFFIAVLSARAILVIMGYPVEASGVGNAIDFACFSGFFGITFYAIFTCGVFREGA